MKLNSKLSTSETKQKSKPGNYIDPITSGALDEQMNRQTGRWMNP